MGEPADRPPHIAIDAQVLRPRMSGVERSVHELLRHLPAAAPQCRFVIYHGRGAPIPRACLESCPSLRCSSLPTSLRPVRLAWQQLVLPFLLRHGRVDLLHAPAYTAPLLTGVPVVLTVYDTIALRFPELSKRLNVLHYRLLLARSARRAARVVVPSVATRNDVVDMLGVSPEKVRVIPLGVADEFQPVETPEELRRARKELRLPSRYILFTGNLEPKKNLPALIEAYVESRRCARITHTLVIAGRKAWRYAEIYRTVRRLRAQELVQFLGPVPSRLMPALYSGASLFVFPSLCEGFGLPPLEAMACGTAVVTTTAGALPEVVGNAALTVRPREVRELRAAMEKVLTNEFLAGKLRELGRTQAKKFSWSEHARAVVALYEEVLETEGRFRE